MKIIIFWILYIFISISVLSIIVVIKNCKLSDFDARYYNSESKYYVYCKSKKELDKLLSQNIFNKYDFVYTYDTSEIYQFDGKNMILLGFFKNYKEKK